MATRHCEQDSARQSCRLSDLLAQVNMLSCVFRRCIVFMLSRRQTCCTTFTPPTITYNTSSSILDLVTLCSEGNTGLRHLEAWEMSTGGVLLLLHQLKRLQAPAMEANSLCSTLDELSMRTQSADTFIRQKFAMSSLTIDYLNQLTPALLRRR